MEKALATETALPSRWLSFFSGFAIAAFTTSVMKVIEMRMIVNLFSVPALALCLGFFGAGIYFRTAKSEQEWARPDLIRLLLIVATCSAVVFNRDFASIALAGYTYYPFPLPRHGEWNLIALVVFLLGGAALHFGLGKTAGKLFEGPDAISRFGWFLAGAGIGGPAAVVALPISHLIVFAAATMFCAAILLSRRMLLVCLACMSILIFGSFHLSASKFFVWGIHPVERVAHQWGYDVKADFITFDQGRCLGIVADGVMMNYLCKDLEHVPRQLEYFLECVLKEHPVKRGLVVGRTAGLYPLMIENIQKKPASWTALEFDAAIGRPLYERLYEFNGRFYHRPGNQVIMGDPRSTMEHLDQTFDAIIYNGIGTKLYPLPRSEIFVENYLMSRSAMDTIFTKLLAPDGLWILDWGSTEADEGKHFISNLPPDVFSRVFWVTFSNYPLSGNPIFLVIASKNKNRLDDATRKIKRATHFEEITFSQIHERYSFDDDRPLHNFDMETLLIVLQAPALLILLGLLAGSFLPRWGASPHRSLPALWVGAAVGFAHALVAGHNPLLLSPLPFPLWTAADLIFPLGLALGYFVFRSRSFLGAVFGAALLGLAVWANFSVASVSWFLLSGLLAGAGGGALVKASVNSESITSRWLGIFFIAQGLGLIACRTVLNFKGFAFNIRMLAVGLGIAALITVLSHLLDRSRTGSMSESRQS